MTLRELSIALARAKPQDRLERSVRLGSRTASKKKGGRS